MAVPVRLLLFALFIFCSTFGAEARGGVPFGISFSENDPVDAEEQYFSADSLEVLFRVPVKSDPILVDMLDWHKEMNERSSTFDGYRVQIFFSSGQNAREKAQQVKKSFLTRFPEYNAYIIYSAPDFKVRVGDFRSKSEALSLKKKVATLYKDSFIVPEQINYPKL